MSATSTKLESLRRSLLSQERKGGALLLVYCPEEELAFRVGYDEIIRELTTKRVAVLILDFRTLVFDLLEKKGLLEKAFRLDAADSRDIRQNLAGMVQSEALLRITTASALQPQAILCCANTASLYPWISYSDLLERTENTVPNTLVLPFPGKEEGPTLHFLGVKDGYNYRAARI